MTSPGRPAVRPGTGVIGEEDILGAWQKGLRKVHVLRGSLVTHQAREAAQRLGMSIIEGPPEERVVPVPDGGSILRRVLLKSSPRWVSSGPGRGADPIIFGKLAVIGAGGVGANTAHLAANGSVAHEVVMVDVVPGVAKATALDLEHVAGITGSISHISGGESLDLVSDADVVVITAGRPRSPGMSRADLVGVNGRVVRQVAERVREHAPRAVVVVVTNPLDEMTMEAYRTTGFPRERVMGMAGTLDSSRFRRSLARAAGVDPIDVSAFTLGSHGDEMVPIVSQATIKGRPLVDFLTDEQIAACVQDTVTAGGQVVALRQTGSATLAPAHAVLEMLDALRGARAGAIPVSVVLEGEYGIEGVVVGVPCLLGPSGLQEVVELPLPDDELEALRGAARAVADRAP